MTTYNAYPLSSVDVTDAYLTNAEDKDIEYLLSLDADRLLAGFYEIFDAHRLSIIGNAEHTYMHCKHNTSSKHGHGVFGLHGSFIC